MKSVCTVPLIVVYLDFCCGGPLILTAEKSRRVVPVVPVVPPHPLPRRASGPCRGQGCELIAPAGHVVKLWRGLKLGWSVDKSTAGWRGRRRRTARESGELRSILGLAFWGLFPSMGRWTRGGKSKAALDGLMGSNKARAGPRPTPHLAPLLLMLESRPVPSNQNTKYTI